MIKRKKRAHKIRLFVIAIAIPLLIQSQSVQKSNVRFVPGDYDYGLKLSYEQQSGQVYGYLSIHGSDHDNNEKFRCKLMFIGRLSKESDTVIKVDFFDPVSLEKYDSGLLIALGNGVMLKSNSQITFCQTIIDLEEGEEFALIKARKFISFGSVKPEKCYIFNKPDSNSRSMKYLVKGDLVSIISKDSNYFKFEFQGKKKTVGWIRREDLQLIEKE